MYEVEIAAKVILPSGGHDHTNQPPTELLGELKDLRTRTKGKGLLKTTTDDNGEILLDYTAPEFGGTIELTAKSTKESVKDKDEITVKVPGLILLPESQNYDQIGGTADHHGPPRNPNRQDNHNHWATQAVNQNIEAVAAEYRRQFPRLTRKHIARAKYSKEKIIAVVVR